MADIELKNLSANAGGWNNNSSVAGSDSAHASGSYAYTRPQFDAVYAQLAGTSLFTGQNTFTVFPVISNATAGSGPNGNTEYLIKNASNAGIGSASGGSGANTL